MRQANPYSWGSKVRRRARLSSQSIESRSCDADSIEHAAHFRGSSRVVEINKDRTKLVEREHECEFDGIVVILMESKSLDREL